MTKDKMLKMLMQFAMDSDFYSCLESKEEVFLLKALLDEHQVDGICQEDLDNWN